MNEIYGKSQKLSSVFSFIHLNLTLESHIHSNCQKPGENEKHEKHEKHEK